MMTLKKLTSLTVLLCVIPAIYFSLFKGKIVAITILCCYPLLFMSIYFFNRINFKHMDQKRIVKVFIVYSIFMFIRGGIIANSFQDWTTLASGQVTLMLFMPLTIYLGAKKESVKYLFRTFLFVIPFIFILYFTTSDRGPFGFTKSLSPIYLFILLIPYLSKKLKILVIIIVILSFFRDITIRANMINIIVAFLILLTYGIKFKSRLLNIIKKIRYILLISPIIFIILGIMGTFNVFKIGDYLENYTMSDNAGRSQDVFVDSRTGIFTDVFTQLEESNAIVFGLGAGGKTKTFLTDVNWGDLDVIYKDGRRGTESGMLNYIQYGGILGGLLYYLLFIKASYLAVYKSRNWFLVMIGVWVIFKGLFSFIGDPLPFTISSVFNFATIGICFNREIREMNNFEIKVFFHKTFNKISNFKFN